jgi:hypothetical protein
MVLFSKAVDFDHAKRPFAACGRVFKHIVTNYAALHALPCSYLNHTLYIL